LHARPVAQYAERDGRYGGEEGELEISDETIDNLIARLAAGPTRRDAVKRIVGAALVTVGVSSIGGDADALKKHRRKRRHHKKQAACAPRPGETQCSRTLCTNLQTDERNCGRCFARCKSESICAHGICTPTASPI
jgi:hypothetical protein